MLKEEEREKRDEKFCFFCFFVHEKKDHETVGEEKSQDFWAKKK